MRMREEGMPKKMVHAKLEGKDQGEDPEQDGLERSKKCEGKLGIILENRKWE